MTTIFIRLVLLIASMHGALAHAADCPSAIFNEAGHPSAYLWQQVFADGQSDLVMSLSPPEAQKELKRITFGGIAEDGCRYQALALARGGDWGWHIAWATAHGVFYARMDGEAWVSSPSKKLSANPANQISFRLVEDHLKLEWLQQNGLAGSAESADEGRSWLAP